MNKAKICLKLCALSSESTSKLERKFNQATWLSNLTRRSNKDCVVIAILCVIIDALR
jgi:hypothetical protein